MTTPTEDARDRDRARDRYRSAANNALKTGTTGLASEESPGTFGAELYGAAASTAPAAAASSLGCGNPVAVADLRKGETVLDLGSGGGLDVILSARRVGPSGRAIGLDMTAEMLDLARHNAATAGVDNAEFLHGHIEQVPLPDASVDVVISNCVIALSTDRRTVFAEISRVLRNGGRVGISDLIADGPSAAADIASITGGCSTEVFAVSEYAKSMEDSGLREVQIQPTRRMADGISAAIIRATKP